MKHEFNRCGDNNSPILEIVDLETKGESEVVVPSQVGQPITQPDAVLIDLSEEEAIRNPPDCDSQAVENKKEEVNELDNGPERVLEPKPLHWRSINTQDNESSEEVSKRPYYRLETIEVHREDPRTESISDAQGHFDLTKSSENTSEGIDSFSFKEDDSRKELSEDRENLLGEESSQEQESLNEQSVKQQSAEENLSKSVKEDERPLLIRSPESALNTATGVLTELINPSVSTSEVQHHINQQTVTDSSESEKKIDLSDDRENLLGEESSQEQENLNEQSVKQQSAEENLSKSVEEDERPLLIRSPESALNTATGVLAELINPSVSTSELQHHLNQQAVTDSSESEKKIELSDDKENLLAEESSQEQENPNKQKSSSEENQSKSLEEDERPLLNISPETASGPLTERIDLSSSNSGNSEFQDRFYQNNDPPNLNDGKPFRDRQNTTSDIPSAILSDSLALDDLTEADSIQEDKPLEDDSNILTICQHFIQREGRHTDLTHISNQGLIQEEASKSEIIYSSGSREVTISESDEEGQDLIDRYESSPGEEIDEDLNIFEAPPEFLNQACPNIFQYNCQNSSLQKDIHIFTSSEEFSKNECLISREQYSDYSFDNFQSFNISQYNHTTDTFLNCISNSENMSMNTLNCSKFQFNQQNEQIQNQDQVRVLTLGDNSFQDSTLYRLKKNYVIEFRLGPSLFGRKISIYCNFPQEENGFLSDFARNNYRLLEWKQDKGCESSEESSLYTQIKCSLAGSFHFYYMPRDSVDKNNICGSGYFLVDPIISSNVGGINHCPLELDCIQCQTVISKHLGSLSGWRKS
ncbi:hypothetical protein WA026_011962 [Henosepilachna vigintioctopunctata]|uniref:Eukaryotic glycogen debranching enzyme N-terminal domain-containing protein n=1 Tax=Henosepilachna vigintioctopunctata TaxID=420089 RepID=A0AAW1VF40_9CUCU